MQFQVNSDNHIQGRDRLARWVEAEVTATIGRFVEHLTRVEVHLGDENGGKAGVADKRCMIEARPAGQPPVTVTHFGPTLDDACTGAARKLRALLDSKFGQRQDVKGAPSIRDAEPEPEP